jgi:hypothetical protein
MAKITKTENDRIIRTTIFNTLLDYCGAGTVTEKEIDGFTFHRINDRQWGVLVIDANGDQRYVRIGAIVAELRDDMTAEELMQSEIDAYNQKQADKAEKAKAKERKIAKDKERRAKEKEVSENV